MHIVLTSDDQITQQRAEAIEAFRRGELDRCVLLFDAIMEHWPLEPTCTMYRAAAQELLDWGIASSYVEAHWPQIEAFMVGGESVLSTPGTSTPHATPSLSHPDSSTPHTQYTAVDLSGLDIPDANAPFFRRPTPTRREQINAFAHTAKEATRHTTPTPELAEWGVELPRELRIVLDLYQQGRRKAARMWARSYLESRADTAQAYAYIQMLPGALQRELQQQPTPASQRPLDLREVHHHDSHAAVARYVPTSATPEPHTRSKYLWLAMGIGGTLFFLQTAMLLYLWLQR